LKLQILKPSHEFRLYKKKSKSNSKRAKKKAKERE